MDLKTPRKDGFREMVGPAIPHCYLRGILGRRVLRFTWIHISLFLSNSVRMSSNINLRYKVLHVDILVLRAF